MRTRPGRPNKTEDQLRRFLADAWIKPKLTPHSRWLEDDPSLRVYVRRAHHLIDGSIREVLDIANAIAEPMGTGRFTHFLEWIEDVQPYDGTFIESIVNPRFEEFFLNRGYIKIEYDDCAMQRNVYRLWNKEE